MSREDERTLSTADFAAAPQAREEREERERVMREDRRERDEPLTQVETGRTAASSASAAQPEPLAELFAQDAAANFRARWDAVQIGFVDDPRQAVKQADELVAQVMKSLAESFSQQRSAIEGAVDAGGQASTESLRVALQRYRSFFQRLLSL